MKEEGELGEMVKCNQGGEEGKLEEKKSQKEEEKKNEKT